MRKTKNTPGIHLYKIRRLKPARKKKGTKTNLVMANHWFWNLIASNGREIARSSEPYTRKGNAVKSMLIAAGAFHGFVVRYYDHSKPDFPLQSYL
jgi:hypothetical protein